VLDTERLAQAAPPAVRKSLIFNDLLKPPSLHSDERFREQQPTLRRR